MMPNFWQLATTPILKIQQLPLGMMILANNLSKDRLFSENLMGLKKYAKSLSYTWSFETVLK